MRAVERSRRTHLSRSRGTVEGSQRRAASAATSGATVPSARAGVHASVRTHSEAQPTQRNTGRPSRASPVDRQSQTSWHGFVARVVTPPVCRPPASLARRGRPADGVGSRPRAGRRIPLVDKGEGPRARRGRLGGQPRRRPRRGRGRRLARGAGAAAGGADLGAYAGARGQRHAPLVGTARRGSRLRGTVTLSVRTGRDARVLVDRSGERRAAVLTVS